MLLFPKRTPHPGPPPFGRGEGESSSGVWRIKAHGAGGNPLFDPEEPAPFLALPGGRRGRRGRVGSGAAFERNSRPARNLARRRSFAGLGRDLFLPTREPVDTAGAGVLWQYGKGGLLGTMGHLGNDAVHQRDGTGARPDWRGLG